MPETETKERIALTHELYVNAERTVLARVWSNGRVEVATREDSDAIWGPPVYLERED